MKKFTRNLKSVGADGVARGELIHQAVRKTIEQAVEEELQAVLGVAPHERGVKPSVLR